MLLGTVTSPGPRAVQTAHQVCCQAVKRIGGDRRKWPGVRRETWKEEREGRERGGRTAAPREGGRGREAETEEEEAERGAEKEAGGREGWGPLGAHSNNGWYSA